MRPEHLEKRKRREGGGEIIRDEAGGVEATKVRPFRIQVRTLIFTPREMAAIER